MGMVINRSPRAVKLYKLLFSNACSVSPFCVLWIQTMVKSFLIKVNLLDCEGNHPKGGHLSF